MRIYTHGPPGSAIRGSRLIRAYCELCGEAMRVSELGLMTICRGCGGPKGVPARRVPRLLAGNSKIQVETEETLNPKLDR